MVEGGVCGEVCTWWRVGYVVRCVHGGGWGMWWGVYMVEGGVCGEVCTWWRVGYVVRCVHGGGWGMW